VGGAGGNAHHGSRNLLLCGIRTAALPREINFPGKSLIVGFLALALTVGAELGLAVALQSQTLAEYLGSRDKVSGSVYLVMLIVFALMPRLRLPNPKKVKVKG